MELGCEIKAPTFAEALLNYQSTANQGLLARICAELQLKQGKKLVITEQEISPYGESTPPNSVRTIIETIIDKVNQNFKPEQFENLETILIVDLRQLPTIGIKHDKLLPYYTVEDPDAIVSGELWHATFGAKGSTIWKPPREEAESSYDGTLSRDGILVEHPSIGAVVFQVAGFSGTEEYYGLCLSTNAPVRDALYEICHYVNTERNDLPQELLLGT